MKSLPSPLAYVAGFSPLSPDHIVDDAEQPNITLCGSFTYRATPRKECNDRRVCTRCKKQIFIQKGITV